MNSKFTLRLALILSLIAAAPSALACGGGSGSYRKPARPGQQHHSPSAPALQQGYAAPPQNVPQ